MRGESDIFPGRPRHPASSPSAPRPPRAGERGFAAFAHPVHEIGRALSEDYGTVPVSVTRGVYKSLKTR
jgi:hypothetical protein